MSTVRCSWDWNKFQGITLATFMLYPELSRLLLNGDPRVKNRTIRVIVWYLPECCRFLWSRYKIHISMYLKHNVRRIVNWRILLQNIRRTTESRNSDWRKSARWDLPVTCKYSSLRCNCEMIQNIKDACGMIQQNRDATTNGYWSIPSIGF